MSFANFHAICVEIHTTFKAFSFEPLKVGNFSQILKEFHNSIEYWHGTPYTSGRTSITISSGCATNIPTFNNISPSPGPDAFINYY
jgi:hypothetical protein